MLPIESLNLVDLQTPIFSPMSLHYRLMENCKLMFNLIQLKQLCYWVNFIQKMGMAIVLIEADIMLN